jgi:hypothetical protein
VDVLHNEHFVHYCGFILDIPAALCTKGRENKSVKAKIVLPRQSYLDNVDICVLTAMAQSFHPKSSMLS